MTDTTKKLDFEAWLLELKSAIVRVSGLNENEAQEYVFDNRLDWREYYDDDYSPLDAANEDMTYWDD